MLMILLTRIIFCGTLGQTGHQVTCREQETNRRALGVNQGGDLIVLKKDWLAKVISVLLNTKCSPAPGLWDVASTAVLVMHKMHTFPDPSYHWSLVLLCPWNSWNFLLEAAPCSYNSGCLPNKMELH